MLNNTDPNEHVNHPAHYNLHPSGIECIDIIEYLTGNMFNTVKYVWRANHKGKGVEDTEKALWYARRELDRVVTSLTEVPEYVYSNAALYAEAEDREDPLRASVVLTAVNAHHSLETYKDVIANVVLMLEKMLEREKVAALPVSA